MVVWAALPSREHPSYDINGVPDMETACCHNAVMVSQKHSCCNTFYRPDALPVAQPTASKHFRYCILLMLFAFSAFSCSLVDVSL